ncbi:MAG: hypothetical protein ACK5CA_00830 [Cyanobacteriota bacterium]|jgi:hypothetical protein
MLTAAAHRQTLRNYAIAAISVITLSAGMTELFQNPARNAVQNTLDTYGGYAKAGMVVYAQSSLK